MTRACHGVLSNIDVEALTVGEIIEILSDYDSDVPVAIMSDRGREWIVDYAYDVDLDTVVLICETA